MMNPGQVSSKAPGLNPYTRICYICGRQFGSKSIDIHEKACADKWGARQATLPKTQRLPLPKRPAEWDAALNSNQCPLELATARNEAAMTSYMDQSRAECQYCSRLEIHLRSCTKDGFFARQAKAKIPDQVSSSDSISGKTPKKAQPKSASESLENSIRSLESVTLSSQRSLGKHSASLKKPEVAKEVPLPSKKVPSNPGLSSSDSVVAKMARFCTGCGSGFKTEQAKFCGECGVKRASIS